MIAGRLGATKALIGLVLCAAARSRLRYQLNIVYQ
jgi:hypothetical protein